MAIQSQPPTLIGGIGTDLWAKPRQRRRVPPVLGCIGDCHQIQSTRPDEMKSLDLIAAATALSIAAAGVDLISTGWITHSAPILDLGLDVA